MARLGSWIEPFSEGIYVRPADAWIDPSQPGVIPGLQEELSVWQVDLPDGVLLPVPADDAAQLRYRLVLTPPATAQEPAGTVQFFVADRLLSQRTAFQTG